MAGVSGGSAVAWPIVMVRSGMGDLSAAELREEHPTRAGLVKVVYVMSGRVAWIASQRIAKPESPAPIEEKA